MVVEPVFFNPDVNDVECFVFRDHFECLFQNSKIEHVQTFRLFFLIWLLLS